MSFTAVFNNIAEHLNSAVFVLLVVLVVSFWLVYKVAEMVTRWKERESEIKELRKEWNKDVPYIKERVNLLFQAFFPNTSIKSSSPVGLTDVGKTISEELDANGIVQEHAETLRKFINQANPKTAYDLQQACFSIVEKQLPELLSEKQLNIAKHQALNHGIPLDNALAVVGVALRDRMLAEKGWSLDDVDTHAPTKK